ncbi:MAG TPA: type IX secretion system membrane protein PorP/SprF, partial [Puia sp.]|nr:type IX secretion system membrane protein PorP/SprF [Puia sp.]
MRIRIVILIFFFQVSGGYILKAQDLHFSQWFNEPLLTNPANTGFIPDADYRLGANYRNQWSSV